MVSLVHQVEHGGGHGDYHPAFGRSFSDQVEIAADPPSWGAKPTRPHAAMPFLSSSRSGRPGVTDNYLEGGGRPSGQVTISRARACVREEVVERASPDSRDEAPRRSKR